MTRVLVIDPVHPDGLALLESREDIELVHVEAYDEATVAEEMACAEAIILRGRRLPRTLFENAPHLRLVSRHGVGCDNLDLPFLQSRGVTVAIAANSNRVSVAEHAMALTLAAAKNLRDADSAARNGAWGRRDAIGAVDICESTVLVVGYGRIGTLYARLAAAFGARVLVCDPVLAPDAKLPQGLTLAPDLDDALPTARFVSLHVPRTQATENLFDGARLAQMAPGSILVNTARGGIVDEGALLAALDAGRPAGYATDVLSSEPPAAGDPLLRHPAAFVTPHSAALTAEGSRRMSVGAAQNVLDFVDGTLAPDMIAGATLGGAG